MMMTRRDAAVKMGVVDGGGQYVTLDVIWIRVYDSLHRELSVGTPHD